MIRSSIHIIKADVHFLERSSFCSNDEWVKRNNKERTRQTAFCSFTISNISWFAHVFFVLI
ncbi:hypothetical protein Hanom_Chr01g00050741 [Helianthus anomalus]